MDSHGSPFAPPTAAPDHRDVGLWGMAVRIHTPILPRQGRGTQGQRGVARKQGT